LDILIVPDMRRFSIWIIPIIVLLACAQNKEEKALEVVPLDMPESSVYDAYPLKLSSWNFFEDPLSDLQAGERVYSYDMNMPLFSDYALKSRFFYLPPDSTMAYDDMEVFDFPVGACLIKNFYYSSETVANQNKRNILETRLLVHEPSGWVALPYVWDEEQKEAYLTLEGASMDVSFTNEQGERRTITYSAPNANQCKSCHMYEGQISPIGPTARQLNQFHQSGQDSSMNQILRFAQLELVRNLPAYDQIPYVPNWETHDDGLLDKRARAYLDINCGHCHRPEGPGKTSGLDLRYESEGYALGIMKRPVAAGKGTGGRHFDLYPGQPDNSILVYRMESTEPSEMMPELGRSVVHEEGVALIREWIARMNHSGDL
jgi:uncharacterized repeat protein (TIGR03806 family)